MPEGMTTTTVIAVKASIFASILTFFEYFGIPIEPFSLLGVLMFWDMILWVIKQIAVNLFWDKKDFKEITSTRASYGLVKKLSILLVICLIAIAIKALGYNPQVLLTLAISWFITAEIYSIIRNWYIINTGKFLPEFNATGLVFSALAWFIRTLLESKMRKLEEKKQKGDSPLQ